MKCKVCNTEMIIGEAINPREREGALYVVPPGNITNDTLEIIEVWKCPKCGHSEFID
jgi:rubrerythrin